MKDVYTKGNVIVNKIQVGDIHYEFDYGMAIVSEVISKPVRNESGYWTWKSKNVYTGEKIKYGVTEGLSHYGVNLYDHEAYVGCKILGREE